MDTKNTLITSVHPPTRKGGACISKIYHTFTDEFLYNIKWKTYVKAMINIYFFTVPLPLQGKQVPKLLLLLFIYKLILCDI